VNAYVSGLGRTRRVVLFDTLVERQPADEVELVVAHELGHRRSRHVAKLTALAMAGAAAFVLILWAALDAPPGPRDLALVLFLGTALEWAAAPFGAALSRRFEREADRFSVEATGGAAVFERAFRELAAANLADLDPPRALYWLFFSHPTAPERIAAARSQRLEKPL
jgi:STE24 endopeptidase